MAGQGRVAGGAAWSEDVGSDFEMDPFFAGKYGGDVESSAAYAKVDEEGLGVHFVDVDLDDVASSRSDGFRR